MISYHKKEQGETSMKNFTILNQQELLERTAGNREVAAVVLNAFIEDARGRLELLAAVIDQPEEQDQMVFHVHTLKGAAANVGAEQLANQAQKLEDVIRETQADAEAELVSLRNAFDRFCKHVAGLFDG